MGVKLITNFKVTIEKSTLLDQEWDFNVKIPPVSIVHDLDALLNSGKKAAQMAMIKATSSDIDLSELFSGGEFDVKSLLEKAKTSGQTGQLMQLLLDAQELADHGLDTKMKAAEIIEPYCGVPNIDDIGDWKSLRDVCDPLAVEALYQAAIEILDQTSGRAFGEKVKNSQSSYAQ